MLFHRDRAVREYHFSRLPEEARRNLAEPPEPRPDGQLTAEEQLSKDALIAFLSEYSLPELQHRVPAEAAREFLELYKNGKLPAWVGKAVKLRELRAASKG